MAIERKTLFNLTTLYAARDCEGLSQPSLDWYHWSFSLSRLSKHSLPEHKAHVWVRTEDPFTADAFITQSGLSSSPLKPVLQFSKES